MRLRVSILGGVVAGAYAAGAVALATGELRGHGCMGWCFGVATLPEFLVLLVLPTQFFYSQAWQYVFIWVFAIGAIGFNAFVLYIVFGGVAWWRGQ